MLQRLKPVLEVLCGLDPNLPVLAGVSGGPDSLCLMDVLVRLGYRLTVAHLNHGLRPEADAEARLVERYAAELGAAFVRQDADVRAAARELRLSIEEAARELRYRFLFRQAEQVGAQAVLVAHTADDQVETLLMHLLRGAGLAGLKGMLYRLCPNPWSAVIPLARPLLGVWRSEILAYVAERGYQPAYDASNLDLTYTRNRLRHELIPYLEGFNRNLKQNLWHTAELLREDYLLLQRQVDQAWEASLLEVDEGYLEFSLTGWQRQPLATQRYLVRRVFEKLHPVARDLDFETVERVLTFIAHPSRSRQMAFSYGVTAALENDRLCFYRPDVLRRVQEAPQVTGETILDLTADAPLVLCSGWELVIRLEPMTPDLWLRLRANPDPYQAWFDLRQVSPPLVVRPRRPGERFRPLGMHGRSLKLSDFMVNVKLPKRWRAGWPLLCAAHKERGEQEVIWVPGYRQGHLGRVTESTEQVLWLRLRRV